MKEKPNWSLTNVPWEIKKEIWLHWSRGETRRETVRFLELNIDTYPNAPSHVDTISKVYEEFQKMPVELLGSLVKELPELEPFIRTKRPDYTDQEPNGFDNGIDSTHEIELSSTALAIAKDLEKFRRYATHLLPTDLIGKVMFIELASTSLAELDLIDQEKATDLLCHLREEFPELKRINDWSSLPYGLITPDFINRLEIKAHKGQFKGHCSHCA